MFLSTMQLLPFECYNVAYKCLVQSKMLDEYEVNMSINEKVIAEKQSFNTNC